VLPNIFVETLILFSWVLRKLKEQQLIEMEISNNIINVFILTL